jgi:hypothetical protein
VNALSIVSIVLVAVTVAGSVFGGVTVLAIVEVGPRPFVARTVPDAITHA